MYKTVLLPIDLNEASSWERALPAALNAVHADGAQLHVLTVIPDLVVGAVGVHFPDDFAEKMRAETRAQIKAFVGKNIPAATAAHTDIAQGTVYQEILHAAGKIGADLIVMASHRPELRDYLLGPNAARVVRHAPCSVLVVR